MTTKTAKHTPTPWTIHKISGAIMSSRGELIINPVNKNYEDNLSFIVRACNSHEELLKACKDACDAIASEYCSHGNLCGPNNDKCYAQKQWKAIAKAEEI